MIVKSLCGVEMKSLDEMLNIKPKSKEIDSMEEANEAMNDIISRL